MLLPLRQLTHQKQTEQYNCVSTCLSIVTGIDEKDVHKELVIDGFESPFSLIAATRFLVRRGIYIEKVGGTMETAIVDNSIYFITCPSSISPAMAHLVVGHCYGGFMTILDPADDLSEEKLYSSNDFTDGNIPCFEYYKLTDCELLE